MSDTNVAVTRDVAMDDPVPIAATDDNVAEPILAEPAIDEPSVAEHSIAEPAIVDTDTAEPIATAEPTTVLRLQAPRPPGRPPFQDEEEGGLWPPLKTLRFRRADAAPLPPTTSAPVIIHGYDLPNDSFCSVHLE
ncbi:hypothetical protein FPSE5266_09797 [Fusarium pseudograminearum]|nr:hypothetical protein FPSE5266_09797 [Fusarium pseudograminearum]